ncbi:MAG: amidohydrolase family protein, partial [Bacteroidales bacterium]|nr:amidohydrolase family protein [Bacteroidales bacterium]
MFALCEERRIPILWHVGDPAPFWREDAPAWARERGWYYGGGAYPSLEELYARAERVLARHPRLNVCFAHLYFCSDDMAHAQRLLDTYPNVRLDITPGTEMYTAFFAAPQRWREFFLRNAARIQLGSDSDFTADGEPLADAQVLALGALLDGPVAAYDFAAHGLALPDAVIKAICHDNFLSFAGRAAPAPIA